MENKLTNEEIILLIENKYFNELTGEDKEKEEMLIRDVIILIEQREKEKVKKVIDNLIKEKRILEKIEETKEPKSEWAMLRAGDIHEREKLELLNEIKKELEIE